MEQRLRNVQILAFSNGPPKLKIPPWSKAEVFEEDSSSEADFSKDPLLEDESSAGFERSRFSHSCERCTPRKTAKDSAREFLAEIQTLDDLDPISEEECEDESFPTAPVLGDLRPPASLVTRQSSMDSDDSGCHVGTGLTGSVLSRVNGPTKPAKLTEKSITPRLGPLNPLKHSHTGRKVETRLGPKKADALVNHSKSGAGDVHEEAQKRIPLAAERQLPTIGTSVQRLRRLVMDSRFTDSRTTKASKLTPAQSVAKRE
ncbi:unnamed protein product [Schistocephalus solidus]|uniref:CDCA2 n=1 Tax=Schistocephalus solidus TaxID=70667 RepID=A0A183T092_SCHSO|nr:unnamed protein product [Schistocephalus solidus]